VHLIQIQIHDEFDPGMIQLEVPIGQVSIDYPLQPVPAWRAVMADLLEYAERHECLHENTTRGGTIWEICSDCGMKWADDKGGKPKYETPAAIKAAHNLLDAK
jgi:ribosomal protein L37AE/L43A